MKIDKALIKTILPNHVMLHTITSEQLFAYLKFQIPSVILFMSPEGLVSNQRVNLFARYYANGKQLIDIETTTNSNTTPVQYDELLDIINVEISNGYIPTVAIEETLFENNKSLIDVLNKEFNSEIISSCVSINLTGDETIGNIYELVYNPLSNGDSNKIYYFEINDTILGFSENGPTLITENMGLNSIDDLFCNKK